MAVGNQYYVFTKKTTAQWDRKVYYKEDQPFLINYLLLIFDHPQVTLAAFRITI